MKQQIEELSLEDAMHLRSAEMWLDVAQPLQALEELQQLTESAWEHAWAKQVLETACQRSSHEDLATFD
jgi:hypothetical protein